MCKVNAQALRWMSKCWLSESPEAVLVKRTPPGGHKCQWSVTSEDGDATQRMAPVKLRTEAPERKWLSALGKTVRGPCHRPHRSWQPPVYKSKLPKDNAFQAEGNTLCSVCLTQPVLVLIPIWVDRLAWLTQQACLAIRLQVVVVHQPKESQAVCELQLRTIGRMDRMLKAWDPAGKGCQKASPISHRENVSAKLKKDGQKSSLAELV